jgi:hypothetical protein
MSKHRTVWAVEQGSYSDYRVVGIFSSKAKADQVVAVLSDGDGYDTPTVAEWIVDPALDALRKGCRPFLIWMLRDGTVERSGAIAASAYNLNGHVFLWKRTKAQDCLNATVWAKSKKHAIKIVNEKRTQMIAEGKWA